MRENKSIVRTPWDSRVFGIDTYELRSISPRILSWVIKTPGHFTAKVHPLSPEKAILQKYGFYYCDTLIQPYCPREAFIFFRHPQAGISYKAGIKELIKISHGAFSYGRFCRDFNLDKRLSDLWYDNWLKQLHGSKKVMALLFQNKCVGFFGFSGNKIILHALSKDYAGKDLAKYLWSLACRELFDKGCAELVSSISASNLAAVNLYVSLGFRFRSPVDIYHRLVRKNENTL